MTSSPPSHTQPMIRIDGSRVKSLREQQGLTQLYIASAVQVTTDTISRWENKKYPAIKRENALRLAEALEVSLEEILEKKKEMSEAPPESVRQNTPEARDTSLRKIWPLLLLSATFGILIVAVVLFFLYPSSKENITATRTAPRFFTPGQPFPVAIELSGTTGRHKAIILKEDLPQGVNILQTHPPVNPDAAQGKSLKWLSKIDGPATFIYIASITDHLEKNVHFSGAIAVSRQDEDEAATRGSNSIQLSRFHWADDNGDQVISDKEILTVYDLFGDIEFLKEDIDLVEEIWLGTGYRWNKADNSYEIIP